MKVKISMKGILYLLCVLCVFSVFYAENNKAKPNTNIIHGMDVSHYQGNIDWEQVKQNQPKIAFVYVKATQSSHDVDPNFNENWESARQAGILRGAYHFFNAQADPKKESDLFISIVKKIEPKDLPPWLDLEGGKYSAVKSVTKEKYVSNVLIWLEEVEKALGIKPIIYASPDFARDHLTDKRFSPYGLAVAEYNPAAKAPEMKGAWKDQPWTFWQFSQTGKVKGINGNVDLDRFNGSIPELLKIARKSGK
jgi:lysozyme